MQKRRRSFWGRGWKHKVIRVIFMKKRWWYIYFLGIGATLAIIFGTEKVVETMSPSSQVVRDRCIILDAGHGGMDGGAVSCTGYPESAINLEIALRLEALFELMGYDTIMIRRADVSVHTKGESIAEKKISDLKERVRIVNETPGGVLVSIHQNTFQDSRYSGAQVFYADTDGSRELAERVQQMLSYSLDPMNKRKCKPSKGVYLMEHIKCTGVLIECGFLSNMEEESRLRDTQYQKKLSASIVSAICGQINSS